MRRLENLVNHLPPESATKTAVRDGMTEEELAAHLAATHDDQGHGPWSRLELRLMALHDQLSWVTYAVYHSQGGKPDAPDPYPRPGVQARPSRVLSPAGAEYLTNLRAKIRAGQERARQEGGDAR